MLNGCPQSIQGDGNEPEVLVVTCGALHSVSTSGVRVLSTWDKASHAGSWPGAVARDANGTAYVSFSRIIGRLRQGSDAEWFMPSACLLPGHAESADCRCTGSRPTSSGEIDSSVAGEPVEALSEGVGGRLLVAIPSSETTWTLLNPSSTG